MRVFPELPELLALVERAGRAVMEVYGRADFGTSLKENDSPLTQADLAANRILEGGLRSLTPDIPILSEESSQAPWEVRRQWPSLWLIDPLDGTREFIKRNDEFTINLALIRDGEPVLGIVQAPALQLMYWCGEGTGAFLREGTMPPRSIRVAEAPAPGQPIRVVVSRSHPSPRLTGFLESLGPCERLPMGSSLKICRVAEGVAHLYPRLGPTMEWDTAAAHAVLSAAGGRLVEPGGSRLAYNKADLHNPHFIASNGGW